MSEFQEFPKIARLSRECVITEKIDGTNAQVWITAPRVEVPAEFVLATNPETRFVMLAGSRNRFLTPTADNFGFAQWVAGHADRLWALGEGRHYGEWWGSGIQRGYGLPSGEKRFSLFNVARWHQAGEAPFATANADPRQMPKVSSEVPACCHVVPVLCRGLFNTQWTDRYVEILREQGSYAAPGFMNPEGIVVFHTASGVMFKKTLEKDEAPKSAHRSA